MSGTRTCRRSWSSRKLTRLTRPACRLLLVLAALGVIGTTTSAAVFELRTYTTNPGKLENLNARFRNHTVALFRKHGMESVGYWVPAEGPRSQDTLIYVLKHESPEAAKASWDAFRADPEWQKVAKESQVDGQILAKRPESVYMTLTDYSPKRPEAASAGQNGPAKEPDKPAKTPTADADAVFELRIYRCNKDQLKNLDARFRDHTIGLFKEHGIESVAYWHPVDEPAAADTLIYIVKHAGRDAARKSWQAFGKDPRWQKVAAESQKNGKFLRERPESTMMHATDYSAIR